MESGEWNRNSRNNETLKCFLKNAAFVLAAVKSSGIHPRHGHFNDHAGTRKDNKREHHRPSATLVSRARLVSSDFSALCSFYNLPVMLRINQKNPPPLVVVAAADWTTLSCRGSHKAGRRWRWRAAAAERWRGPTRCSLGSSKTSRWRWLVLRGILAASPGLVSKEGSTFSSSNYLVSQSGEVRVRESHLSRSSRYRTKFEGPHCTPLEPAFHWKALRTNTKIGRVCFREWIPSLQPSIQKVNVVIGNNISVSTLSLVQCWILLSMTSKLMTPNSSMFVSVRLELLPLNQR